MHSVLIGIKSHLEALISQMRAAIPNDEPLGNAHGNWSFPGLSRVDLIREAQELIDLIDHDAGDDLDAQYAASLNDYIRRIQHLSQHTVPQIWGNANQAVPAYMFTLQGLRKALRSALSRDSSVDTAAKLRKVASQIRAMEARLNGLEPRTASIALMVDRIEKAYNAADQLPTDLESLAEARQRIDGLLQDSTKDHGRLTDILDRANLVDGQLKLYSDDAMNVLDRCEKAYSAATSVGLAAAFGERSDQLAKSMWLWVGGLVVALISGGYFGSERLHVMSELLKVADASTSVIVLNLLLSFLSVAAPIWFAWLATKQVGQRFRLSEDYAFKASVSRAYEGFRREAARFDGDMEARLLASALTRFDEIPLRLVESDSHGSPWHELISSDAVKQAMKVVPGFSDKVKDFAENALKPLRRADMKSEAREVGERAAG